MMARRGGGAVFWDHNADLFDGPGLSGYAERLATNDNLRINALEVA